MPNFPRGPLRPQKFFVPPRNFPPVDALLATPTGVGRAVAALSVAHQLSTAPIGVGSVTAALTVSPLKALAASPTGVGRASGTLSLAHLLAATAVGVAKVTSDLSGGSLVAPPDGTGTGWRRRQQVQAPPARSDVQLQAGIVGNGLLRGSLTIWTPAFSPDELAVIASLVDEEDLAVLLSI